MPRRLVASLDWNFNVSLFAICRRYARVQSTPRRLKRRFGRPKRRFGRPKFVSDVRNVVLDVRNVISDVRNGVSEVRRGVSDVRNVVGVRKRTGTKMIVNVALRLVSR